MAARKRAGARRLAAYFRRSRTQLVILVGIVLLACVGFLGAGWYYSVALKDRALDPDHEPDKLDLRVLALQDGLVTLSATSEAQEDGDWTRDGVFGLQWEGGYGRVGDIVIQNGDTLLLQVGPHFAAAHRNNTDFFLVSSVEDSRAVRHERANRRLMLTTRWAAALG